MFFFAKRQTDGRTDRQTERPTKRDLARCAEGCPMAIIEISATQWSFFLPQTSSGSRKPSIEIKSGRRMKVMNDRVGTTTGSIKSGIGPSGLQAMPRTGSGRDMQRPWRAHEEHENKTICLFGLMSRVLEVGSGTIVGGAFHPTRQLVRFSPPNMPYLVNSKFILKFPRWSCKLQNHMCLPLPFRPLLLL